MRITDDYKNYIKGNHDLLDILKNSDSILYSKLEDLLYVLDYITEFYDKNNENERNDDLVVIFETGFEYFHEQLETIKFFWEKAINKDFILLKRYELLIHLLLCIDDFIESLQELDYYTNERKQTINSLINEIEKIINNKLDYSNDLYQEFNLTIESIIPKKVVLTSTHDIFFKIAEEMKLTR